MYGPILVMNPTSKTVTLKPEVPLGTTHLLTDDNLENTDFLDMGGTPLTELTEIAKELLKMPEEKEPPQVVPITPITLSPKMAAGERNQPLALK